MAQSVDIVKAVYEALSKGDVAGVLAAFDAQIQWREAEGYRYVEGNPYIGPKAVAEGVFQRVVSDVDGFAVVPERFIEAGDTVVVEGRYRGTMNATGTPIDAPFAHVWQLHGGKVVHFRQYTDTKQWSDATG